MATADTIAIKCPGCQAGFDVPTSLAGKTIRCTSCKTQLPVPAGRARGAAEALPTAKPARPSNGPPAKSAADLLPKGKPTRPRDDDDEDDDDEDDRPARRSSKKKKASGGSAMPLILGVVGVLVLAGGGVGAYFVFKKDAPAAASNSSGGGTTAPDAGSKGGPPRGMTPPAGATPPGGDGTAPAGWKTYQGDGFTIAFPDLPLDKKSMPNPLTGANMSMVGAERAGKDGVFAVVVQELSAATRSLDPKDYLKRELESVTSGLLGALGGPKFNVVKKEETTVDGHPGAEVELADNEKHLVMRLAVAHGRMYQALAGHEGKPGHAEDARQFLTSLKITTPSSDPGQQVAVNTPGAPEAGPPGRPGFSRKGADGGPVAGGPPPGMTFQTPNPGGTTPMPGPGGPPPGMTFPMPGPGGTTPMPGPGGPPPGMTFPTPGGPPPGMTFPMPGPGGPPPGMTFPMPGPGGPPPGMTFPMPGPGAPPPAAPPAGTFPMGGVPPGALNPGGGTPGFGGTAGGAGYVTPALATQIDPFFTIAFDLDKSEVFTVSVKVTGGKASYSLNRYTYPAFIHKGDWKIPGLAVRSAIDTANGKLYLATAPLTQTLYTQQKGDRNAGAGDIAVYDLAAIRDGKVKERSDLKPAATIAAGGPVRGLDVSADGKVLTVLTSRNTSKGGKASLRQYDTADRKLVKEKELPNAAWDMVRAGDKLYVLEDPRASGQSLLACDAATLEPQPLALPPGTTDVAYGPDGKLVAASGASQGKAGDLTVVERGAPQKKVLMTAGRKNQNGYARFTPDGKRLLVASHGVEPQNFGPGLDVYDVADPGDPNSYKKVATVRSAGGQYVGGYFYLSPDGERVVVQLTGAVLETAKLTEHVGGPEPPGLNGGPGGPGEPGVIGPGAGPMGPGRGGPGAGPMQPGAAPPPVLGGPGAAPPPVLGGPGAPMPVPPGPPGAAPAPPPTLPVPGDGGAAPPAVEGPGRRPGPGAPPAPGDAPRPGFPPGR